MNCTKCFGTGVVPDTSVSDPKFIGVSVNSVVYFVPCQECGGYGTIHCCDGMCEQPDNE